MCAIASNGNYIFAGTFDDGLFRSADNGDNWTPVDLGIERLGVYSFAVKGDTLFAGTYYNGIFYSTDHGESWKAIGSGLSTENAIETILIKGDRMFAIDVFHGIYVSTDGGVHWTQIKTDIPSDQLCLASDGDILYVGTNGNGVYKLADNDLHWTPAGSGLPAKAQVSSIAVHDGMIIAGLLFHGVYRSTNKGDSWSAANEGLMDIQIKELVFKGDTLLAGAARGGVFMSTDNGSHWSSWSRGLSGSTIYSLATNNDTLVAGTSWNGISRSIDIGARWEQINAGLPPNAFIRSLLVLPPAPGINCPTYFAASDTNGIFLFGDNGSSWTKSISGLPVFGSGPAGSVSSAASLGTNGTDVYAAIQPDGVFASTDRGTHWTDLHLNDRGTYCVAAIGNRLYAGGFGNLYGSPDGGQDWALIRDDGFLNAFFYTLLIKDSTIFAGTMNRGVYRSRLDDTVWTEVNTGLPPVMTMMQPAVFSLASYGDIIIACTLGGGVYYSDDEGDHWNSFNEGLKNMHVYSLAVSGENLYAGTLIGGVWKRHLAELTSITHRPPAGPRNFQLGQNYPNPFNPVTAIPFTIPKAIRVTLKIFDVLGRMTSILVDEELPAGSYTKKWDASAFPSGVYFYRLQTGATAETGKMLLLK